MKKTALAVITLAILSSLLYAQKTASLQLSKAAIDVDGTKLRLGMSKGEVTDKLVGDEITKYHEDDWFVGPPEKDGPTLQFTNGRLSYADRNWVTYDNDTAEALFGAVNS